MEETMDQTAENTFSFDIEPIKKPTAPTIT